MISATHAHTGPVVAGRGLRDDALKARNSLVERYSASLPGKVAEVVRRAESALAPGTVKVARGQEHTLAFNRRFHMADGSVGWNPGKLNLKILKPAGPIDPEVAIVHFEACAGSHRPLATYVNYAVHLDNIGGLNILADMPGILSSLLGLVKGPDMVTVYTTGCCGDINHINVHWAEPQHGFENSARMGIILAGAVLETWPELRPISEGPLRVKRETVPLPLPKISRSDVETRTRSSLAIGIPRQSSRLFSKRSMPTRCSMWTLNRGNLSGLRFRSSHWETILPGYHSPARSSWSWGWLSSRTLLSRIRLSPSWQTGRSATFRPAEPTRKETMKL